MPGEESKKPTKGEKKYKAEEGDNELASKGEEEQKVLGWRASFIQAVKSRTIDQLRNLTFHTPG